MFNFIKDFFKIFQNANKDLSMYLKKDPTASSKAKVFFTSTAFHGLLNYRFSHFFYKYKLYFISYLIHIFGKILYSMEIHPAAELEAGIVIDHGFGIVIGETAKVGEGTLIYHGVTLGSKKVVKGKRHPEIGKDVMLGSGAKILGPIFVGNGSIIGSNSVVLMDIPPKSLAVGIPAKIKKINCTSNSVMYLNDKISNADFII
ncbi:serine O-acetyltransferase EpsC [Oceanotoga teriensis]|uniref:Serine acetyltransferase n=1 Tax=Oceanotoga teriensis TaxID=515440 RepID=A0AA45HJN0_9BACT|nr:serine O-acetyltransferase EpsC [Oceanotoga teriensis]MDO7977824.1 serine acetyltransferase [Oceanotoga teriensis]PWJ96508.1 serine O-acetyltransferase [Oceanotoga teriensis]